MTLQIADGLKGNSLGFVHEDLLDLFTSVIPFIFNYLIKQHLIRLLACILAGMEVFFLQGLGQLGEGPGHFPVEGNDVLQTFAEGLGGLIVAFQGS